jgi:hypothetical protein
MTIEKKFEEIKSIRFSIKNTFKTLTEKHKEIKDQYKKYIENNKKSELLDSFYFQIKLMDYEYETAEKTYNLIDNRMYCDYYKLFIIVYNFFKLQFKNEKSEMIIKNSKYPVYKDLDQFKKYDFDTVNDIHQDIIRLIEYIHKIIQQNENDIKTHQISVNNGLNIDNYIYNLEYNNNLIINNVSLYKKYLSSYHKYHISFLTNLNNRLNLIFEQLENDVNFVQPLKEKKNAMILKMCIMCSMKEAEYCSSCMNEDKDEYVRFANLRNSIQNEDDFEIVNGPVTGQPVNTDPNPDIEDIVEPIVEPLVEPVVEPIIEPLLEPTVEPSVEPSVEPLVEPVIDPIIEPLLEPTVEPSVEPLVEPLLEPVIEPVVESLIEPTVEPSVEPVVDPIIEPLLEHVIEPVVEPLVEPVVEPSVEPIIEQTVEPIVEPVVEPVLQPVIEPVTEPLIEPIVEPVVVQNVDPIVEPIVEPVVVQNVEPIIEPIVEPVVVQNVEPLIEPVLQPVIEPNIDPIVEPLVEPNVESIVEPVIEPLIEPTVEPIVEPLLEIRQLKNVVLEPINEVIEISNTYTDITVDNTTDTKNIEQKINTTPPFFIDLNLHLPNEISHAPQKKKKNKKSKK